MLASVPLVPTFVRGGAATGYERRNRDTSRGATPLANRRDHMKTYASMTRFAAIALAAGLATSAAAQDSIKVGVIQPLTGAFAASGNYVANGARIAADEVNAKGGVLGKKIELVIEDNK